MTKKNEVAKKEDNALVAVPDFMKGDAGLGTENLRSEDLEIPRLQVLQSLSPEVADGDEKAGALYHTVLEKALADKNEELKVVVIYSDIRYMLWRPRHEGGGILARAEKGADGMYHWNPAGAEFQVKPHKNNPKSVTWKTANTVEESGLDKFGSSDPDDPNSQPAAVKMWNYVVVLPDFPELGPMVLTMQRGAAGTAKNFSSKLKSIPDAPSFGLVFTMRSKLKNTGAGDFYDLDLERTGFVSDKEQYTHYKKLYDQFSEMGVKIHNEEATQEDAPSKGGSAPRDLKSGIKM